MDYKDDIKSYILEEKHVLDSLNIDDINTVMNVFEETRKSRNRIFICGNGGSAATASHFVCYFNKGVNEFVEPKYNFECLSDNVPTMMAVSNDIDYAEVFRLPLSCKLQQGDLVVGISGSGNSRNVVNAFEYAQKHGGKTVAIVGYDGGKMFKMSDYHIHVNVNNMQVVEDLHMIMDHLMMYTLCKCNKK